MDATDFWPDKSLRALVGDYGELQGYDMMYEKYKTVKVVLRFQPTKYMNNLNIADSMVKVFFDMNDDTSHNDMTYDNLTSPTVYAKAMSPWSITFDMNKDELGVPIPMTDITTAEDFNAHVYILSDGHAMIELSSLTGAVGPIVKIGQSPQEQLFLRIGTLVARAKIKLSNRRHTNDELV